MSDYVLDLSGIRKTYRGGVEALKGIDLQVPRGCIYGLLGPNGAGKSTMVKILTTLIRKSGGDGTMLGKPIGDRGTLQKVGLLPEHARFPDYLTGRQVIEFTAGLQDVASAETKQRTDALLELVQMTDAQNRKMKGYSKGMKQRIGIAQALVNNPEIVFLDEPTDGVDPAGRRDFRILMKRLREEGRTIFINTHILSELEPIVDRVAIISHGELLGEGELDDLRSQKPEYQIEFEGVISQETQISMEKGGLSVESGLITMDTSKAGDVQHVIDHLRGEGVVISRVEKKTQSLEELFMGFVEQSSVSAPPPLPGAAVQPPVIPNA
ncbi:MAG: ABC-2 type transport system ATP-binding protein [Akkermansiaceae bacterium]|jgi:ABC-2 type transport system ATP-binding protein